MIGEVIVDLGFADRDTVEQAVSAARAQGRPTGQVLVERGVLRHDQLARAVAERFGLDYIDLSVYDLDMGAVNLIRSETAKRYQAVPVGYTDDGTLLLAMADPTNVLTIDDVAMMTGRRIKVAAASVEDLNLLLTRLAQMDDSIEDIVDDEPDDDSEPDLLAEEADRDAPVIKLVHSIVAQAVQQGASDIHINPEEGDTRVLFRVDGVLSPAATVKRRMAMSVVSRIKIMGDLNIAEKRLPQDGRFALTVDGRRVDIRVVTLPLVHGEGVVLRILDRGVTVEGLESLGMAQDEMKRFSSAIAKPNGAVLVTGPTGSGKSTTLAGMVNHCNDNRPDHIITIEDPIEFVHESKRCLVNQREVHRDTLGFTEALRSALREDPDIVLVGEMRDLETIRLALTAAETGHLVFGTLHTSSAAKTIDRIVDVFPAAEKEMVRAMMSESLRAVISQTLMKRVGGGRIAAHEIMIGTPAIRNLIREGKIAQMYSAIQTGQGQGMQTLDQCLQELVQKGVVSREEAKYKAQNKDSI